MLRRASSRETARRSLRSLRQIACLGGLSIASSIAAGACQTPTQITLDLTTDAACPDETATGDKLIQIAIVAGAPHALRDLTPSASTNTCRPKGANSQGTQAVGTALNEIGTLVLVPDASTDAGVEVLIVAGVENVKGVRLSSDACLDEVQHSTMQPGDPCIVARRRLGFVPHTKLELPVQLDVLCTGVVCDQDSTCANGTCQSADTQCDDQGNCNLGGGGSTTVTSSSQATGMGGAPSTSSGGGMGGVPVTSSSDVTTTDVSSSMSSSDVSSSNSSNVSSSNSSSVSTSVSTSVSSTSSGTCDFTSCNATCFTSGLDCNGACMCQCLDINCTPHCLTLGLGPGTCSLGPSGPCTCAAATTSSATTVGAGGAGSGPTSSSSLMMGGMGGCGGAGFGGGSSGSLGMTHCMR